jgi:hypothetical protein
MKKKFFEDDLLYVVDGELMNQLIKLLSALDIIDAGPEKQKVLGYFIKAIKQVSNHPTGEAKDELDYVEFENWLWKNGIRLPNPEDPNNPYPNEDSYDY